MINILVFKLNLLAELPIFLRFTKKSAYRKSHINLSLKNLAGKYFMCFLQKKETKREFKIVKLLMK
jgi:hypothetical protein